MTVTKELIEKYAAGAYSARDQNLPLYVYQAHFREFADALTAALSAQPATQVAVKPLEWHRSDGSMSTLLYTLRQDGWRKGEPVMFNDVMVRIEKSPKSETDLEPIITCILSALITPPASLRDENERLRTALQAIIDMNVQYAADKYGDASKAETMACVMTARAALKGGEA